MQKHEPKNNLAPQIQCCIPTLSIKKNTLTPNNAGNCENRIPSYQQQICDSSSHWPRQAFSSSKRHEEQTNMFRLNLVSTTAPCPTAHSPPSTAITSTPYSSASFVSSSCRKKIIAWNALFPWAFRKHYRATYTFITGYDFEENLTSHRSAIIFKTFLQTTQGQIWLVFLQCAEKLEKETYRDKPSRLYSAHLLSNSNIHLDSSHYLWWIKLTKFKNPTPEQYEGYCNPVNTLEHASI